MDNRLFLRSFFYLCHPRNPRFNRFLCFLVPDIIVDLFFENLEWQRGVLQHSVVWERSFQVWPGLIAVVNPGRSKVLRRRLPGRR